MLGAIREDDVPFDPGEAENSPQDESFGSFVRVLHHFHDPYRNWPLTVGGVELGNRAPDWAIRGAAGSDGHENGFSVAAAREAMWRALTLRVAPTRPFSDGPLHELSFAPTVNIATRESLRTAYWATTFRALGDAVHLLQDMAQPQHTRNDPHAGVGCAYGECSGGHKSYFEAYVEARIKGGTSFTLRERFFRDHGIKNITEGVRARTINFGGYPVPRHSRFDDFYSTASGSASLAGRGLANYSNQGFYSAGTVVGTLPAGFYGAPPAAIASLATERIAAGAVENAAGDVVNGGAILLLSGPVSDAMNPAKSESNVRLASYGAFDQFLNATSLRHATLNHYNYADQARLLIPRAVAYSAGLLDYFFRGMLEIGLPDEGVFAAIDSSAPVCKDTCGFGRVKLKLTNATPDEVVGPGVAVAVAKFHRNLCYRGDLSGEPGGPNFSSATCRNPEEEIVVSSAKAIASLPTGSTQTLAFDFAQRAIPINATDIALQVVYRGKLGNEDDAVVVTTRNIAEPNHLALENSTDYRFIAGTGTYALSGAPATFTGATVTFGSAAAPLATAATIPAPGYAQVSFLADKTGTPVRIDFAAPNLAGGRPLTLTLPAFEFYLPAGTGATYASNWQVGMVRGAFRRFVYSVARSQNYEVYQCAPDFNPAACGEAMLSPLTAANAVPWVVTFQ